MGALHDEIMRQKLPPAMADAIETRNRVFSKSVVHAIEAQRRRNELVDEKSVQMLVDARDRMRPGFGRRLLDAAAAAEHGALTMPGPDGASLFEVAETASGIDAATTARVEQARAATEAGPRSRAVVVDPLGPLREEVRQLREEQETIGAASVRAIERLTRAFAADGKKAARRHWAGIFVASFLSTALGYVVAAFLL